MADYEAAAEALRDALKASGMSKTDFAKACEVTYVTANRWTNGIGFSQDNQRKAEEVLGLRLGELAGDDPLVGLAPEDEASAGRVPPKDELLKEIPGAPGWNEALQKLRGVLEDLPSHTIWHLQGASGRDGKWRYESWKEMILSFKRVQDRESGVDTLDPPEDTSMGDEVKRRLAERTRKKKRRAR